MEILRKLFLLLLLFFFFPIPVFPSSFEVSRFACAKQLRVKRGFSSCKDLPERIVPKRLSYSPNALSGAVKKLSSKKKYLYFSSLPPDKVGVFRLVNSKYLYFLPYDELLVNWGKRGKKVIYLTSGVYSLKTLHRLFGSLVIRRGNLYIIRVPVVVGPDATLKIVKSNVGLSFEDKANLIVLGKLYVFRSLIFTYSLRKKGYYPIGKIPMENYYYYGRIPPRPYILILKRGKVYAVDSRFKGLGFRGLNAKFGFSLSNLRKNTLNVLAGSYYNAPYLLLDSLGGGHPSGVILGNDFYDNYMGFFSNGAREVFVAGNYFYRNYQYNFDPHDWSKELYIGYNIFERARKAHGLVFSRFTEGYVFNNLSIGNHGAGIMMDRRSRAYIFGNIAAYNGIGGISLLESDGNFILNNYSFRNGAYGIYVRNSLNALVKGNTLFTNGGYGVEVAVVDISYQIYRNLYKDWYHLASSSWLESNHFGNNLTGAVKSKCGGLAFFKNRFPKSSYLFSLSLSPYTWKILTLQGKEPVIIPGKGDLRWIGYRTTNLPLDLLSVLSDLKVKPYLALSTVKEILSLSAKREFLSHLTFKDVSKLLPLASKGSPQALWILGTSLLKEPSLKKEALAILWESAVLGSVNSKMTLVLLYKLGYLNDTLAEETFDVARSNIKSGNLIPRAVCEFFGVFPIKLSKEKKKSVKKAFFAFERVLAFESSSPMEHLLREEEAVFDSSNGKRIASVKALIEKKNVRFKKFFAWLKDIIKNKPSCIKEPDTLEFLMCLRKRGWKSEVYKGLLSEYEERDFNRFKSLAKAFLKEFNSYRTPDSRIKEEAFLKRIKEEYFEGKSH
ncbi:right-handed parallel beta-helix repeat-containing protein [Thermovibrio sp.]